ncbi:MAG: SH3 domain-containing protein [Blautia sp.]|nr:SH3 domain-containing protein [Blautia sp.]
MYKRMLMIGMLCMGCSLPMSYSVFAEEVPVTLEAEENEKDLEILNKTGRKAEELYIKRADEDNWETDLLKDGNILKPEKDVVYDLKLVDDQEEELIIFNLKLSEMDELQIYEKKGDSYVIYHDVEKDEEISTEKYAVHAEEKSLTFYTTSRLNVRELPDTSEKVLEVLPLGQEITVYGRTGDWYLIRSGEGYGYISQNYVTDDKEKADALVAQAKASVQAPAAAQTQTYVQQPEEDSQQAAQEPQEQAPQAVYEVSRENIPGCDDPDHGVTYITYSDGSVEAVEY